MIGEVTMEGAVILKGKKTPAEEEGLKRERGGERDTSAHLAITFFFCLGEVTYFSGPSVAELVSGITFPTDWNSGYFKQIKSCPAVYP